MPEEPSVAGITLRLQLLTVVLQRPGGRRLQRGLGRRHELDGAGRLGRPRADYTGVGTASVVLRSSRSFASRSCLLANRPAGPVGRAAGASRWRSLLTRLLVRTRCSVPRAASARPDSGDADEVYRAVTLERRSGRCRRRHRGDDGLPGAGPAGNGARRPLTKGQKEHEPEPGGDSVRVGDTVPRPGRGGDRAAADRLRQVVGGVSPVRRGAARSGHRPGGPGSPAAAERHRLPAGLLRGALPGRGRRAGARVAGGPGDRLRADRLAGQAADRGRSAAGAGRARGPAGRGARAGRAGRARRGASGWTPWPSRPNRSTPTSSANRPTRRSSSTPPAPPARPRARCSPS